MTVRVVGYANWYYRECVKPRNSTVKRLVDRVLLDFQNSKLENHEVQFLDPEQLEVIVSTKLGIIRTEEPELWKRLIKDIGDAGKAGEPVKLIAVRFFKLLPPRRVVIRFAAYGADENARIFWMSVGKKRS